MNEELKQTPFYLEKQLTIQQMNEIENINTSLTVRARQVQEPEARPEIYNERIYKITNESTFKNLIVRIFEEPTLYEKVQPEGQTIKTYIYIVPTENDEYFMEVEGMR